MADNSPQVPADVETTHEMLVAVTIMAGIGMLAVIVAGQSKQAGNLIAGILAIMLVVQGITHVNPFVAFIADHPLTPSNIATSNPYTKQPSAPNKTVGRMRTE